jgi:hypothetical protein
LYHGDSGGAVDSHFSHPRRTSDKWTLLLAACAWS